jgi:hypothetical protein
MNNALYLLIYQILTQASQQRKRPDAFGVRSYLADMELNYGVGAGTSGRVYAVTSPPRSLRLS